MDRRQLLKTAGAAACVAAVPNLLTIPLVGQGTPHGWNETLVGARALAAMKPLLEKYDKTKGVHSLTPDEWGLLAQLHDAYFLEHHWNGDLEGADAALRKHEDYFKTRFHPAGVTYIATHGLHATLSRVPRELYRVAEKIRLEPYTPAASIFSCDGMWDTFAIAAGILAILNPEVVLFGWLAVYYGIIPFFACTDAYNPN